MKPNYRTEAEWLADFDALMKTRAFDAAMAPKLQHTKASLIRRPIGELKHTPPVKIGRSS